MFSWNNACRRDITASNVCSIIISEQRKYYNLYLSHILYFCLSSLSHRLFHKCLNFLLPFLFFLFLFLQYLSSTGRLLNFLFSVFASGGILGFSFLFLLIYSILENVIVIYFGWVGNVISFLYNKVYKISMLFETSQPIYLTPVHLSGARKCELLTWHLSLNHQLPCLNHNFSYWFPRNQFMLREG